MHNESESLLINPTHGGTMFPQIIQRFPVYKRRTASASARIPQSGRAFRASDDGLIIPVASFIRSLHNRIMPVDNHSSVNSQRGRKDPNLHAQLVETPGNSQWCPMHAISLLLSPSSVVLSTAAILSLAFIGYLGLSICAGVRFCYPRRGCNTDTNTNSGVDLILTRFQWNRTAGSRVLNRPHSNHVTN